MTAADRRCSLPIANAGHIPWQESCVQQATVWANDCERKLLGLHCGQMLDRTRHREWARLNWREFWWALPSGTRGYVPRQGLFAGQAMP